MPLLPSSATILSVVDVVLLKNPRLFSFVNV
uniref:Uncharacterized protein n=1 Tax=Rhizophora mucronata TaxID=61149 RepID=A0A2P2MW40_RHIMU